MPRTKLTTTLGAITFELDEGKAPASVKNFVQYVTDGHYVGTLFHRVIDGFMIQGGGYDKDLKKKPTRQAIENEGKNGLKNVRGAVAMARTPDINSATSQFFINVVDNSFLDYKDDSSQGYGYAVFGQVVDGMDVVDKIKLVATTGRGPFAKDCPEQDVAITAAEMID
jgi:peptidyl-prolyl cis-trans isomerase B (cyclophilin B)